MPGVEVNGTRLEYVDQGSGPPIVFVHAGLNDLRAWTHQLEGFGSKYRTVALSCRHHHPNQEIPKGAVLPLDDLVAFLERHGALAAARAE